MAEKDGRLRATRYAVSGNTEQAPSGKMKTSVMSGMF